MTIPKIAIKHGLCAYVSTHYMVQGRLQKECECVKTAARALKGGIAHAEEMNGTSSHPQALDEVKKLAAAHAAARRKYNELRRATKGIAQAAADVAVKAIITGLLLRSSNKYNAPSAYEIANQLVANYPLSYSISRSDRAATSGVLLSVKPDDTTLREMYTWGVPKCVDDYGIYAIVKDSVKNKLTEAACKILKDGEACEFLRHLDVLKDHQEVASRADEIVENFKKLMRIMGEFEANMITLCTISPDKLVKLGAEGLLDRVLGFLEGLGLMYNQFRKEGRLSDNGCAHKHLSVAIPRTLSAIPRVSELVLKVQQVISNHEDLKKHGDEFPPYVYPKYTLCTNARGQRCSLETPYKRIMKYFSDLSRCGTLSIADAEADAESAHSAYTKSPLHARILEDQKKFQEACLLPATTIRDRVATFAHVAGIAATNIAAMSPAAILVAAGDIGHFDFAGNAEPTTTSLENISDGLVYRNFAEVYATLE